MLKARPLQLWRLFGGQNDNLALKNGIGVGQTVAIALENGAVCAGLAILGGGDFAQGVASLNRVQLLTGGSDRSRDSGGAAQFLGQCDDRAFFQSHPLVGILEGVTLGVAAVWTV